LKVQDGIVLHKLKSQAVGEDILAFWNELVAEEIVAEEEDDEFA